MRLGVAASLIALGVSLPGTAPTAKSGGETATCAVRLVILGVAQDAGKPQIGNHEDPAWADPSLRRLATSIALVDTRDRDGPPRRWLFEATPAITEQLYLLDRAAPSPHAIGLDGIFLTHAHIGHYAGLMMLGHEAAGASGIPLYVMPRMAGYLSENGPWSQLVAFGNVALRVMTPGDSVTIGKGLAVTPLLVPHRQEFSEVVGFRITGPAKSALFLPDIDRWEDWDDRGVRVEDVIASVDHAFVDATFFSDDELPGRDMSQIPHPTVVSSMARFSDLPPIERRKVQFIHFNHSNPLLDPQADERVTVSAGGFKVTDENDHFCL